MKPGSEKLDSNLLALISNPFVALSLASPRYKSRRPEKCQATCHVNVSIVTRSSGV